MYLKPGQSLTQNARNNFVVKVYSIVSIQLLITTTFVALNIISEAFATIQANYMSLFWLSIVMIFVSMIVLFLSESQSKVFPNNLVWLTLFTVGQSYIVSCICSMYTPESVLLSAVATLAATLGVTFYALTTKTDFTSMGNSVTGNFINKKAFGFALFNILFWVSLVNIFLVQSPFATLAIAWGMGIVYTIYLIVDTQMVLGGKNKSLTLDNYALGAMIIYADIIQLFLQILKILGKKKRE